MPPKKPADSLGDYPRPSVAVDVALLTVRRGELQVLLVRRPEGDEAGRFALPGRFLRPHQTLVDAVHDCLQEKVGIRGRAPRQLHVFDEPGRDSRGWVLSVAHVDVVPYAELEPVLSPGDRELRPVDDFLSAELHEPLPYDHEQIIGFAAAAVRAEYAANPDPAGLLESEFTMSELRAVHEAVAGSRLQRDTFRRLMEPQLVATDKRVAPLGSESLLSLQGDPAMRSDLRSAGSGRGRPAQVYRRREQPLRMRAI
ncbi:NUDIX hydrolase [Zafaria cholistanensis]|uniref:NUDIX hydrolase n=1 Tax=Zafaria cholistanensis TaxID=1682741 RepID=A0A5A7NSA7_9MICC|nr:NUDIX domain-containing protein [Zafaria cholistanensis]GER23599.1 NUDIX hydrolase [Zafaria cholistanensis]